MDPVRNEVGGSDSKAVYRRTIPLWQVHLRYQVCGQNSPASASYADHFHIGDRS